MYINQWCARQVFPVNKLETALSRDRLACLAPPDMVFSCTGCTPLFCVLKGLFLEEGARGNYPSPSPLPGLGLNQQSRSTGTYMYILNSCPTTFPHTSPQSPLPSLVGLLCTCMYTSYIQQQSHKDTTHTMYNTQTTGVVYSGFFLEIFFRGEIRTS